MKVQESEDDSRHELTEALVGEQLARWFKWSLITSIAVVALGTLLSIIRDRRLPSEAVDMGDVPRMLVQGDSAAVLTFGVLLLLLGPTLGVVYLALAYFRMNDRRFGLLAVGVLLIIVISVPVGLLTRE